MSSTESNSKLTSSPKPDGLVLTRLSTVKPEQVDWLWKARIPRGKLTLLVGDPEAGKTFVSLDFAARVSRGAKWPDGAAASQGGVILLAVEDGLADTIRPRLDALGADTSRISVAEAIREDGKERAFTLEHDLPALESAVRAEEARLVVIDPLSAYLGKANSWKDAEVRAVLTPLAQMAERTSAAILGIVHLNKNQEQGLLHRVQGSVGFVAVARVVMTAKQGDDGRRTLSVAKNNLAPAAPDLTYRITTEGCLEWESAPSSAKRALPTGETDKATKWLRNILVAGPRSMEEVATEATAAGISSSALRRARERLAIRSKREGTFNGGCWMLSLPAAPEPLPSSTGETSETHKMDEMAPHPAQPVHLDPPGKEATNSKGNDG